jgi:hypothetical protein
VIDPKTPGYDRWCETARRAHSDGWNFATPETREPWIVEARQKEIDADKARGSHNRAVAGGPDSLKPGVNLRIVEGPGVLSGGFARPKPPPNVEPG